MKKVNSMNITTGAANNVKYLSELPKILSAFDVTSASLFGL